MAGLIRYHVNVYWEKAPDRRTSRTPDWLNDACEARIKEDERRDGKVTYAVLMSPASICFDKLSFDWKHPLAHASRAKLRLSKRKYTSGFPVSLLVAVKPNTTDTANTTGADRATREIKPYVLLLGMMKRHGRRAVVRKCMPTEISRHPGQGDLKCRLKVGTAIIDIGFATKFEAAVLLKCLKLSSEPGAKPAAAKSAP